MTGCVRPQVDPFGSQCTPVGSICGPLAELGRRSCGADVAGWLNATVPPRVLAERMEAVEAQSKRYPDVQAHGRGPTNRGHVHFHAQTA